jgi:hypothetical protein
MITYCFVCAVLPASSSKLGLDLLLAVAVRSRCSQGASSLGRPLGCRNNGAPVASWHACAPHGRPAAVHRKVATAVGSDLSRKRGLITATIGSDSSDMRHGAYVCGGGGGLRIRRQGIQSGAMDKVSRIGEWGIECLSRATGG